MLNKILILVSMSFTLNASVYAMDQRVDHVPIIVLSNLDAVDELTACVLSSDAEYKGNGIFDACCSKSQGKCTICPSSGKGSCVSVDYHIKDPRFKNMVSKPKASVGDFIAPPPKSTSPRDRLKRNTSPTLPAKDKTPTETNTVPTVKTEQKQKLLKSNTQLK